MCLGNFLVEIHGEEKIAAEESSIDFGYDELFDLWELKGEGKFLVVREASLLSIQGGKELELLKRPQRWFSPEKVVNFKVDFKTKEIFVFTRDASYFLKPSEKALIT